MRASLIAVIILFLAVASTGSVTQSFDHEARRLFHEFKQTYGKNYNGYDNEKRFIIFKENLKRAEQHQRDELGTAEYGVTQFSDLTAEEFQNYYANARFDEEHDSLTFTETIKKQAIPESFDWREHGAVGPVENQGACGSCWAFSVVGNIEGQWFIKKGKLLQLSKQELLDCDKMDHGCHGGYPLNTYKEIMRLGGLETSSDYPYVTHSQECRLNKSQIAARINGSVKISQDEEIQAQWLHERGPMSVTLNAKYLQFYRGGIHRPKNCLASGINHAVLTVGFGTENGTQFWIVKNSWSAYFGEKGYFRIHRGSGACGINRMATSAVIE